MNRYEAIVAIVQSIPAEKRTRAATAAVVLIGFPAFTFVAIVTALLR